MRVTITHDTPGYTVGRSYAMATDTALALIAEGLAVAETESAQKNALKTIENTRLKHEKMENARIDTGNTVGTMPKRAKRKRAKRDNNGG